MVSYLLSIYKQNKHIFQKITTKPLPMARIIKTIVIDERISVTQQYHCYNMAVTERYRVRKSETQLVYYLLIVLLIKRHVSAYSEAIIRFNKC